MEKLTSRQAGILIFLSVIGLKAVLLPAIIYYFAGNSGYIAVFFSLGFDFLLLLSYLFILKQNPNDSFFDIISYSFGKTFTKIVTTILFIYYTTKTLLLLVSTFNFFVQVLYDDMNSLFYMISTLMLLLFTLKKNLRTFGRVSEIIFWVVFVSINIVLLITSIGMDITNVLPVFQNGLEPIANTSFRTAFAFGDYSIMIFLLGNIKQTKKTNTTIISYALVAISTILNFFIVFLCTFGYTVINQNLAIADLSLYIDLAVAVSRLEWIAIFAWTTTLIVQLTIYANLSKRSLDYILPKKIKSYSPYIVVVLLAILYLIEETTINTLMQYFLTPPFAIGSIIIQVGIPALLLIAHFIKHRRKVAYVQSYPKTT